VSQTKSTASNEHNLVDKFQTRP